MEAAMIGSQIPSTSIPATSFIIPVINAKNPSRILRSASGQFIVSAATTPTTQQLMAQEVVDKEIEVNAFRRESEEAKAHLAKVKVRLGELEKECVAYREKAMAIDANRNSTLATSLEKIAAQEREIAMLKSELERNAQLVKDMDRIKKEHEFLELQNESLNAMLDSKEAAIRDLEDNILAMKMDAACKLESGSATPKADAFSLFDIDSTKFFPDTKTPITSGAVNAFRRESEEAKAHLAKVKVRLGELEKECVAYREKAMAIDANRNSTLATSLEKIAAQEREIAMLKSELERNAQLVKDMDRIKKEHEFLELQNESLNAMLDSKEAAIRDLEDNILAMKMDAACKLESGSATPKADAFSLFDIDSTKFFPDTKTPITSGANDGPGSAQISQGMASSSSSEGGKIQLSAATSKFIWKQLNTTLECRVLAKCLKDIAAKAITGDIPSVDRLLGCRSDSMSESEPEPARTTPKSMSLSCAEKHIKKVAEDLERVEKDLNSLRESFVEYYQRKIAEELKQDESCRIQ
ncbi:unnamed protein product [Gongylonema pulchrum]|uniref:Uncharacterized protein n=1 Tax=Gongylonema pulchrum TaxID=637853 RepID=A0A3P7MGQ3_9BILA|nr:unnamed protein product [Gongylonema pulchrum]